MQSATYNSAVHHVEARNILFSGMQFSFYCNAVWLKWRMQPCYLSKAVRHPYPHYPPSTQKLYYHKNQEKKRKNSIKRRKESTSVWILIRYNAVHYVDLSSSILIAKKCTDLDNSPKTQSSHFLTVASIHWSNHEKRGDDVPDFQRTNKSLLIAEPLGSCHVNLKQSPTTLPPRSTSPTSCQGEQRRKHNCFVPPKTPLHLLLRSSFH